MNPAFLPFALQDLPRYTSYPTAAQFTDGFPGAQADGWLRALPADATLSAYVHVPFCAQLCWYCGCHTTVPNGYDRAGRYGELLRRDIARAGGLSGAARGRVEHVHFGGGTPTYLNDADLAAVLDAIDTAFGLAPGGEVAIEIDPRTLVRGRAGELARMGFNRASLGVQDFAEETQRLINRIQPEAEVAAAVDDLRAAGFLSVNFDLIYGLPAQTEASVRATAMSAARMRPDRLAVFGYAHVPWFKKHQRMIDAAALPGLNERYRQAMAIAEVLEREGYVAIGLDHFARPDDPLAKAAAAGAVRRNFQGYTTDVSSALLAFGTSGISEFPQGFAQAARDTLEWSQAVEANVSPVRRGLATTPEDRARAHVIETLMCNLSVDAGLLESAGAGAASAAIERLTPMVDAGLARLDNGVVNLAAENRLFLRAVASAFDAHFQAKPNQHARAI